MKFLDEAQIEVRAGNGGAGMSHFRREKFVPMGGPDGGDGGSGGSVILKVDGGKHTLLDLQMNPVWHAEHGKGGGTSRCTGRCGADLVIRVPMGTQVFRGEEMLFDLAENNAEEVLARGGRGGKGNAHFKSSTNRAPEYSQPGEEGEAGIFRLVLKLVADVGLIGLPNAGKSTLISSISAARPKIADYPFTTLVPNLGVVDLGGGSFVVADIPGLIPGAHEGKGLGIRFLKHVERTRVLAHLIDCNQVLEDMEAGDTLRSYKLICNELACYTDELGDKAQIVVFTKLDTLFDREQILEAAREFEQAGARPLLISSASGEGVKDFIETAARMLAEAGEPVPAE